MGLETGNNIADLIRTNPTGGDPKSQGDDHLRLIKTALLNDLVGFPGAIAVTGPDGGVVNAYTVTPVTGTLIAYGLRMLVIFSPAVTNTGPSTMNIGGLGVVNIRAVDGAALVANDLVLGNIYAAFHNGTEFRLLSITKNYADQLAFSSALPAQSLGFLGSTGTVSGFTKAFTGYAVDESKGADIASAATINLTTATGNLVHVTGSVGITGITIPVGSERTVVFDGAPTLTNSAALILPGGANITAAAGDTMTVRGDTGGARVVGYQRASGTPISGGMVLLNPGGTIPTASPNADFLTTFNASYDNYLIIGSAVRPAANATFLMQLAVAGAADTGSNYYSVPINGSGAVAAANQAISGGSVTTAGLGISFEIKILNVNDAVNLKTIISSETNQTAAATYVNFTGGGIYPAANAVSGFRLFWSGSNNFLVSGKIRVYGYNN